MVTEGFAIASYCVDNIIIIAKALECIKELDGVGISK